MEGETIIKIEKHILDAIENYFSNFYTCMSTDSKTREDYDGYVQDLSLHRDHSE